MANVAVYNMQGETVGTMELNDAVFGVKVNEHVVHEVVVAQLANKRQGTQSAKTRSEVSGGGRKPWRQKGTGHARQGSIRAPQWRHGGIALGPKPREYGFSINKKVKQLAMKSALSDKVANDAFQVLDDFGLSGIKTKEAVKVLDALGSAKKVLVVTPEKNDVIYKSARNIAGVKVSPANALSVYDIVNADKVVILKDAVAKIEEVYA